MIVYDLQCAAGHIFEGWFEDGEAFEAQKKESLVACPVCNELNVSKLPSAFAIKASRAPKEEMRLPADPEALGKKIGEFIEKNFDDVGCDFSKEALKMHYGASEQRNIRGTSTKEEEKTLKEEGIPFFKVPVPPDSES